MIIGVTDTIVSDHKYKMYEEWLKSGAGGVECRRLSYKLDNLRDIPLCDAFILTGGHDVDPRFYGGPVDHPKIRNIDRKRDDFERNALEMAMSAEVPILGICRGLQLANVHFGGSLVPDLEDAGFENHRSMNDAERRHGVVVERASTLYSIVGRASGEINTSHHQAAARVGKGLRVAATSTDGVIEALEFDREREGNFFLLVQWHPERMTDLENPFAAAILNSFFNSIRLFNDK